MRRATATLAALIATCSASEPPADWVPRIARGDMKWTDDLPYPLGGLTAGYYPVVGNGYLAKEPSPFVQRWENTWPWRDSGSIHVAGVNNGQGFGGADGPSHRAQLPGLVDVVIQPDAGGTYVNWGTAVDYAQAAVFNRTQVHVPGRCENTIVETRHYAHRVHRHLLVADVRAFAANASLPWSGCTLSVAWNATMWSPDLSLSPAGYAGGAAVWQGVNLVAEEPWLNLTHVGVAYDAWLDNVTELTFTSAAATISCHVLVYTDVPGDDTGGLSPSAAAANAWAQLHAANATTLFDEHVAAWDALWSGGGIELVGNASLGGVLNASLYDILSSMRPEWQWSSSPGGLGTNGYCGHTFWDQDVWILPVLLMLHPELARNAVEYRLARLNASMVRAKENGYSGAFWVWESAITGLDTAPWRGADLYENHISADVPRAWQQYYYATGNVTWLATAWPALNETCRFWECRFTRTDSVGVGAQAGPRCAPKDGVGNFTVHGVVCPDESSGVVNDSIYTNAAAAGTLAWCLEAADVLGVPSDALPAVWRDIVAAPYMPLVDKQCPTGPVHQEYTGYNGHTINQADVALLQYPLGLKFDADLARRDLDYWANQTDFGGMFTGDAAYSAAYLALGVRTAADAQLQEAWPHIEPHFNVFKEKADDTGTQHFITGAGGLLQSFLYGYAGLRVQRVGVLSFTSQQPVLPPLGVTRVTLRGMHLFGVAFDFMYDAKSICVRLQQQQQPGADSTSLQVRLVPTGKTFAMPAASQPFACVELQPVEVFVRGYA